MKHDSIGEAAKTLGITLAPLARGRLERYEELLVGRAALLGMISKRDVERVRERHLLDSMRAVAALSSTDRRICDLGSGAGLPGLVLACISPDIEVVLTEVRHNRATFLTMAIEDLGLSHVRVWGRRIETLRERYDVCTARAFADAARSWAAADRLLSPSGRLIYWAGERFDATLDAPRGISTLLLETPALARSGPLAIMSRQ